MKSEQTAKRLLTALAVPASVTAAAHIASALTVDRIVHDVELDYFSRKIGPSLDGYTAVFLSDIHTMPASKLRQVVERINLRGVDLLLLGGDFPRGSSLWRALLILRHVQTRDGIFGVAGNHDRPREYFHAMKKLGMRPLGNEGVLIRDNLYLAGTEDLRVGKPDVAASTRNAGPDDFILLLTHNPDTAVLQDSGRADLALSGHTHGGQITLFGLWAPVMTVYRHFFRYGHRLRTGWARTPGGTDIYVGNGLGNHKGIPRVFAQPQIVYLTLRSK